VRKPEQRVWDAMRSKAPPGVWLERVENVVADGMPDVHVLMHGKMAWVELKAAVCPARSSTRLLGVNGLRQSQINWHLKAAARSLPVYTLVRDDSMRLYLVHADHATAINDFTAAQLQAASIADSWAGIYQELTK